MKITATKSRLKLTPREREVIALRRAMIVTRENFKRELGVVCNIWNKMERQREEWSTMADHHDELVAALQLYADSDSKPTGIFNNDPRPARNVLAKITAAKEVAHA